MCNNKYNYVFDPIAQTNLTDIFEYISTQLCNPSAALQLFNDFTKAIEQIRTFPESGVVRYEDIRRVPVNNYLLYYIPLHETKTVYIVKITHSRQLFANEDFS